MRRLPLLLAAGALWLFLAAIPALADGGPHIANSLNGSLGLNADGCAGCHRIHTAQGPLLLKAADETALCLTCHGAAVNGATTDVMTGVQYQLTGSAPYLRNGSVSSPGVWSGTQLGALRGGGYDEARIGDPTKLLGAVGGHGPASASKIAVGAAQPVTSAHLDLDGGGGVVAKNIAWGNGQNGSGVGPTVDLTCVACHNPHGNGNYRILRPIPELAGTTEADLITYNVLVADASNERVYLETSAPLLVGDPVTITGNSGTGVNVSGTVSEIGNDNYRTYVKLTGVDITVSGTGGTLTRDSGRVVADAALPATGDVRNYTVIQRPSSALLYASQVLAPSTRTDINAILSSDATTNAITTVDSYGFAAGDMVSINFHNGVASVTSVAILTADVADLITTAAAHNLVVGDIALISGVTGATPSLASYSCTVGTVPSGTTFTCKGLDITVAGTGGTVTKSINATYKVLATPTASSFTLEDPWNLGSALDITTSGAKYGWVSWNASVAAYSSTDGDYFHRYGDWSSFAGYDNPVGTSPSTSASTSATFDDQITQWCSTCHTRYYAWQNIENQVNIASADQTTEVITTSTAHGLVTGQQITFTGADITGITNGSRYYILTAPTTTTFTISTASGGSTLNLTSNGTGVGQILSWGPAYDVARPGDDVYKIQHRTRDNRACTTCHVAHGSNAVMDGTFSSTLPYPGEVTGSASSRLLKVDNRGTCQLCHDPTSTAQSGWVLGASSATAQH